jgi:hypothetical protein
MTVQVGLDLLKLCYICTVSRKHTENINFSASTVTDDGMWLCTNQCMSTVFYSYYYRNF